MRLKNKGFSLVEVIVSLAILTIVGGAISGFLIAGNNTYIRGSRDITIQEETQLTTNQMIDLIIDVQNDIKFEPSSGDLYGPEIDVTGNIVAGTNVPIKQLILYNDSNIMMLRWQGGTGENANEVFLIENTNKWVDGTDLTTEVAEGTEGAKLIYGTIDVESTEVTRSLLAQYVTDFDVDLSKLDKRKVKLNMTFDHQGKKYEVHETIKLRNEFGTDENLYAWITGIEISPSPVTLMPGGSQAFTYKMTGDKAAMDEGVIWTFKRVDGKAMDSKTTLNSNGKLSIGQDEPTGGNGGEGAANAAIEVTVTSVADPTKSASAWVTVEEQAIDAIYIVPSRTTLIQGEELEFECVIEGSAEAKEKGVSEWTVEANGKPLSAETTITPIGTNKIKAKLKVAKNQSVGINVIKITAQSAATPSAKGRAEAYVSVNEYTSVSGIYDVKLIASNLTTYELDDEGNLGYVATIECLTNYADYANGYPKIVWEETTIGSSAYTFVDEPTNVATPMSKQEIWDERNSLGDRAVGTDPYTKKPIPNYVTNMYCGTQLDTHAYVRATVYLDEVNSMVIGIDITIPNLEKAVDPDSPYIYSDNFVLFRQDKIDLELRGIGDDIKPEQITWEVSNIGEYAELENVAYYETWDSSGYHKNYVNGVGFGRAKRNGGDVYDGSPGRAGAYMLNPTGVGRKTTMDAEWCVNASKEYRLNVVAKVDGEKVAETNVLVPKVDFLFPNGRRYMTLDTNSYHYIAPATYDENGNLSATSCVPIIPYGYTSKNQIAMTSALSAELRSENKMSNSTFLGDTACHWGTDSEGNVIFNVKLQIGWDEPNDIILLVLEDPTYGEDSRRNLVLYINHKN